MLIFAWMVCLVIFTIPGPGSENGSYICQDRVSRQKRKKVSGDLPPECPGDNSWLHYTVVFTWSGVFQQIADSIFTRTDCPSENNRPESYY